MIFVPRDASDEQVLKIIRGWIDLLVGENYHAAFEAITLETEDAAHPTWAPDFIRDDIKNYRSPLYYPGVEDFRVTDWRTAQGGNPEARHDVIWYRPSPDWSLAGAVAFDLPLNGIWSSLTADFVFWENDNLNEGFRLGLEEISSWEQRTNS